MDTYTIYLPRVRKLQATNKARCPSVLGWGIQYYTANTREREFLRVVPSSYRAEEGRSLEGRVRAGSQPEDPKHGLVRTSISTWSLLWAFEGLTQPAELNDH